MSVEEAEITEWEKDHRGPLLDEEKGHPDGVEESQDEPGTNSERMKVSVMSHWDVRMN